MNKKKFTNTALVALVIMLVGVAGYFMFPKKPVEQKSSSLSIGTLAQVAVNIIPAGGSQSSQSLADGVPVEPVQSVVSPVRVSPPASQASFPATGVAGSGFPVRLTIPAIGVDAAVQYVGVATSGAMVAPKGIKDVAWFKIGPRPGDVGSAVLAGHYGTNSGVVFSNLHKLKKGDDVYVEDNEGEKLHFVVREIRTYGWNEDASDVFGSSDGKAHLNLITCEGNWNSVDNSYSNRLVVFTDRQN